MTQSLIFTRGFKKFSKKFRGQSQKIISIYFNLIYYLLRSCYFIFIIYKVDFVKTSKMRTEQFYKNIAVFIHVFTFSYERKYEKLKLKGL